MKRSQWKFKNSFTKTKTELKAINSKLPNTEEWTSDPKARTMEIIQSQLQTERQVRKKKMKAISKTSGIIRVSQPMHNWNPE